MITITVGKTLADFTSLSAALATLTGTTLSDETKIVFIDSEDYEEINTIQNITTSPTNCLTIEGKFNRLDRSRLFHSTVSGYLITLLASNVIIKGLEFDRSEPIDDNRSGIVIGASWSNIDISHNHFYGNGYYYQDAITSYNYGMLRNCYNNLFKMWGHSAWMSYCSALNEEHNIWNNTFVKCQECIDYSGAAVFSSNISAWNNIFDMDASYLKECTAFAAILVPAGVVPTAFKKLENNLYNLRTHTAMYVYADASIFTPGPLKFASLADMQSAYPSVEVEGIEDDPDFVIYCADYHLLPDSPAIESADGNIPVDDNDGETRTYPGNRGCYEESHGLLLKAEPHIDELQNDTYHMELTDLRSSGAKRKLRISLDYVRML